MKVLLLENINTKATELFQFKNHDVDCHTGSINKEQLIEIIGNYHVIGIRSKTNLDKDVLSHATNLIAIGCFCIGTNQVDLEYAQNKGICVFNSPFMNTRSVAELVISLVIGLSRKLGDTNINMHNGIWTKSASGCHEVRGKTLGIIGYGHVGSQVSILAENIGLKVIYYDIANVMSLGNSRKCMTMDEVLIESDFLSLHVPLTSDTDNMITKEHLDKMKKGSYLLNLSRGNVVDINDLSEYLRMGHLAGSAVDVYPEEPKANTKDWKNILQNCPNTILTPHIGGSTEEAQTSIAVDVANKLLGYMVCGSSEESVNIPNLDITSYGLYYNILNIHYNNPGVMFKMVSIVNKYKLNIEKQFLSTNETIGYCIVRVKNTYNRELIEQIKREVEEIPESIKTRIC